MRLRTELAKPAGPVGWRRRRPSLGAHFQSRGSGSSAPGSLNLRGFAGSPGQGWGDVTGEGAGRGARARGGGGRGRRFPFPASGFAKLESRLRQLLLNSSTSSPAGGGWLAELLERGFSRSGPTMGLAPPGRLGPFRVVSSTCPSLLALPLGLGVGGRGCWCLITDSGAGVPSSVCVKSSVCVCASLLQDSVCVCVCQIFRVCPIFRVCVCVRARACPRSRASLLQN